MKNKTELPQNELGYPKYTGQCGCCKYMRVIEYYDKLNNIWWDGFCCVIPNSVFGENVFRAIGNKNGNNDCDDFEELKNDK